MVLESFIVANAAMLATKMIYVKITDRHETYHKVVNDGLYHVTTKEAALKIMESGVINPSNNILSLGSEKTFFFAGIPSYNDLAANIANSLSEKELYAIKVNIKHDELADFKTRPYNDNSIIYEGKYEIPKENVEIVNLVYDLDDNKNVYIRNKTKDEIDNYEQSDELIEKIGSTNKFISTLKGLGVSYFKEYSSLGKIIKDQTFTLVSEISTKNTFNQNKIDELVAMKNNLIVENDFENVKNNQKSR